MPHAPHRDPVASEFGRWQRFQEKHNQPDAFLTDQARARSTGKRHRPVDEDDRLLDVVEP